MAELLSTFLPILLMKAGHSLLKELTFMGGIEGCRKKLHLLLLAINDVIADAEEQASKRPAVKSWIAQLKLAAWEADDTLDEMHYEALRHDARSRGHKVNSGVKGFLSPRYNPFLLDYKIGKRLQKIIEKISDLVLQMNQFGLIKDQPVTIGDRMQTHSYVDEEEVIGRDKERQEIVRMLLHASGEKLSIIPIVGIGVLGKTTLAQLIFNDTEVKAHYQKHMWVCVSEDFDVPAIVKKIIDSAVGSDCGLKNDNMELLQQRLRQELSHKRYFLVLDDVWNEDVGKWDDLKSLLGCCAIGSAVIVTTRSLKVASIMGTLDPIRLKHLSPEESWIIFSRKAFGACLAESSEFVVVGKKIVLKCGGVPLAVKSMGGLMSSKLDIRDWENILESNTWDDESQILPALRLSYKHLPSTIKQCFVFCAVYPKDYEIDKNHLIHLWISNGFIPFPSEGTFDVEAEANHIFLELLWRSFFQDIKKVRSCEKEKYGYCDVTTFKLHDLMHDLAAYTTGDECFYLQDFAETKKIPKDARHVALHHPRMTSFMMRHCRNIRSIFILSKDVRYLPGFKWTNSTLRVIGLHISGTKISFEPAFMKHLRYLDLSCSAVEVIPEAMTALYNLQVLMLNECHYLIRLPEGMKFMVNLRHVYLDGCDCLKFMPADLGQLSYLQTLTKYIVGKDPGHGIKELKNLKLGGKLQIYDLVNVTKQSEAKEANLEGKKNLELLTLCWDTAEHSYPQVSRAKDSTVNLAEEILDALKPHNCLQVLNVYKYMGIKFPSWWIDNLTLQRLVELRLYGCVNCTKIPPLYQLPCLEVLELKWINSLAYLGNSYSHNEGYDHLPMIFPKLKLLSLERMEVFQGWHETDSNKVSSVTFAVLDAMEIIDCPTLITLPNVPMLKSLCVTGNKVLIGVAKSLPALSYLCLGASRRRLSKKGKSDYVYEDAGQGNHDAQENIFPDNFSCWGSLKKLYLEGFNSLFQEDEVRASHYMTLKTEYLNLTSCDCFIQSDKFLSPLWFWKIFVNLEHLDIYYCGSLTFWPEEEFESLASLKKLLIRNCKSFTGSPPAAPLSVNLAPDEGMYNLEELRICDCPNLVVFPTCFTCLKFLSIQNCSKVEFLPEGLGRLGTLDSLQIAACPSLKSLPASIQFLSNLKYLNLYRCNSLTQLPEGMHNLIALKTLCVQSCHSLKAFPEGLQHRLHSLQKFLIRYNPTLARRCKRGGDYWDKVKDIPDLEVVVEQVSFRGDTMHKSTAYKIIPKCMDAWNTRSSSARQPFN